MKTVRACVRRVLSLRCDWDRDGVTKRRGDFQTGLRQAQKPSTRQFFILFLLPSFLLLAAAVVFLVAQNEYFDVISRLVSFRWHTSPKVLSHLHHPLSSRRCSFITLFLLLLNSLLFARLPLSLPLFLPSIPFRRRRCWNSFGTVCATSATRSRRSPDSSPYSILPFPYLFGWKIRCSVTRKFHGPPVSHLSASKRAASLPPPSSSQTLSHETVETVPLGQ